MNYWLMKSEPNAFSIDDLIKSPHQTAHWDGVRNYQARNMMRNQMCAGDQAFFYHSSTQSPAIFGIIEIIRQGYPDFTAFDPTNIHFDPKSTAEHPRWYMVDVRFIRKLKRPITLSEIKHQQAHFLDDLPLLKKGNRLSIMPVSEKAWQTILSLEKE